MNEITVIERGEILAPKMITEDLYSRFTSYIDAKPKTVATYTRAIRQFASFLSLRGITQPRREDILAFREELQATGHKPTTVQNYITATRLFFQWTAQEGIYPNIAEHIKGAKLSKEHKKDYLTSKQVKKILASIDRSTVQGLRDYAMLSLMITGGLRTIEVSRADVGDITFKRERRVLKVWGKGHAEKDDFVVLTDEAWIPIEQYLQERGDCKPQEPLFATHGLGHAGGRMSTRSIQDICKKNLRAIGLDGHEYSAHSLRHTTGTQILKNGGSMMDVQQVLRHTSPSTSQLYVNTIMEEKRLDDASEQILDGSFKK